MKKLAVIVPCYNEELVIAESYRRTRGALQKLPVLTEIIYINDGSRDRTRPIHSRIAGKGAGERGLLRPQVPRRGRTFQESDGESLLPYAELYE